MSKSICLVDLSWILYKSHYAYSNLSNGHVYGTLRFIRALRQCTNAPIVLCVDKHPKKKLEIAPHYKGNRSTERFNVHIATSDVISLLSGVEKVYFSFSEETEADDIMAYWALNVGYPCTIISGDDDLLQVTDDRVRIARSIEDGKLIYCASDHTLLKYGVEPRHLAMWKVIARDSSDNLIGIPRFPRDMLKALCWKYERPHNLIDVRREVMDEFGLSVARIKYIVELYRLLPHMISLYDNIIHLPTIVSSMEEPSMKRGRFNPKLINKYALGASIQKFLRGEL